MKTCSWPEEQCDNLCEGETDYCGSHNRAIRKIVTDELLFSQKRAQTIAKAEAKSMIPKPAIKKVSDKRKEQNIEYFALVEQFKKDNPKCMARIDGCTRSTEDPHHSRGRGEYLLDVSTWIPVCRNCHIYIEQHPLDAQKRNLSFSRLEKIETT